MNFKFQISNFKLSPGYTLIELLVSISIIALLAVFVAPELANLNKSQSVADATELIKQKLLEAQAMALAPPSGNNKADAYGLKLISSGGTTNQIQLQAHYPDGIKTIGRIVALDNSKIINVIPAGIEIIWYALSQPNKINYTFTNDSDFQSLVTEDVEVTVGNLFNSDSDQRVIKINKESGVINVTEL